MPQQQQSPACDAADIHQAHEALEDLLAEFHDEVAGHDPAVKAERQSLADYAAEIIAVLGDLDQHSDEAIAATINGKAD